MDVSAILEDLNKDQREAITSESQYQLVLAGAGSGKTRVLVHRMAWLVDVQQQSPHSLLAVTFTNKAAREMRSRVETMLGINSRSLWVGTFHGIAHRLLSHHWQEAGLPQNFQIIDSDDQQRAIKRVIKSLDLDEKNWPAKQAQWFINEQKDEGLRAHEVDTEHDHYRQVQVKIYTEYEKVCQQNGFVDFGELLLRSHEMWLNNPNLLAHYQDIFKHILVDEFQDTNRIQYAWLQVLAGKNASVMVVGDDDQSIYGWRGARIENIQNFSKMFSGTHDIRLEQNYRSTGNILKAANAVITRNSNRLGKNLWTDSPDGEQIPLFAAFNEVEEARYIADAAKRWVEGGNLRSDFAILYRSNAQSRVLEDAFIRLSIPYRIYSGQRFYERIEIRNALAYMRLVANPNDDAAFERVINTPTRGIGQKTIELIRSTAREKNISLWQTAVLMTSASQLTARAANAVNGFIQLVQELTADFPTLAIAEFTDHLISASGLIDFHKAEKGERGQARVDNLHELVSACKAYKPQDEDTDVLLQFLADAALDAGDAQAEEEQDAVQMMTLHSAKGLEFPMVVLCGLEEGLFPHSMSSNDPQRLEEERRLAYVGLTRAEKKLVLTYAESRRIHGAENYNSMSRFVRDIPKPLLQEVRASAGFSRNAITTTAQSALSMVYREQDIGIKLGQTVHHPKFGNGLVLNMEGEGPNARIQVNFEDAGSKWLVMSFAKLKVIE